MKTSYYLAAAAVLAAAGVVVYARLPAPQSSGPPKPVAGPPASPFPSLPPLAIEPPDTPVKLPPVPPPAAPTPTLPQIPPATKPTPLPAVPPPPESSRPPKAPALPAVPVPPSPVAHAPGSPTKPPLPAVPPPESVRPAVTPVSPTAAAPSATKFVLLADGKLVEGEVGEAADKVTVRRGAIEQAFPKDKVQLVAASKDEVYRHLLAKVPATDAAARMKFARWMLLAGMRDQARREALEVVKLDPANAAAAQMARSLEESLRLFPESGKPAEVAPSAPPATPVPGLPAVPPPATQDIIPPTVTEPEPAVPAEAATAFPTKVQPILANVCADCHAKPTHTGSFKLAPAEGFDLRPQVIAQNLRAVAGQLRKDDPSASPLLLKGAALHGGMKQPAFTGKVAAYAALEAWVYSAVGTPVARPIPSAVPPIPPAIPPAAADALPVAPMPPGVPVPSAPPTAIPALPTVPAPPSLPSGVPMPPGAERSKFGSDIPPVPPSGPSPTNAGPPVDEFDPSVFNRAVRPGS